MFPSCSARGEDEGFAFRLASLGWREFDVCAPFSASQDDIQLNQQRRTEFLFCSQAGDTQVSGIGLLTLQLYTGSWRSAPVSAPGSEGETPAAIRSSNPGSTMLSLDSRKRPRWGPEGKDITILTYTRGRPDGGQSGKFPHCAGEHLEEGRGVPCLEQLVCWPRTESGETCWLSRTWEETQG